MGFESYISETEAASLAGVSSATLNRFAEAGYLQIESDSDGLRLYSKKELENVFGIRDLHASELLRDAGRQMGEVSIEDETQADQRAEESSSMELDSNESLELETELSEELTQGGAQEVDAQTETSQEEVLSESEEREEESESSNDLLKESEKVESFIPPAASPEKVVYLSSNNAALASEPLFQAESAQAQMSSESVSNTNSHLDALEQEVSKFKNICQLQEKLLDERDKQLADMKEEVRWLRQRLERAEEKSDRDQLLLLSETQLIRQMLIREDEKRKSRFRAALEWMGLLPAEQQKQKSTAIEMKSPRNQ